jgi:hypothetical protein
VVGRLLSGQSVCRFTPRRQLVAVFVEGRWGRLQPPPQLRPPIPRPPRDGNDFGIPQPEQRAEPRRLTANAVRDVAAGDAK